jgi:two-component system, NtrC family, sensor kinase
MNALNLNTWFARPKSDFREAFSEFSKSLTLIVDLDQLKDNVIAKIREIIRVDSILIFLMNPDQNRFDLAESRGIEDFGDCGLVFFPDEPLIRWFTVNETHLVVSKNPQIVEYFSERERDILDRTGAELIFPLLVMNRITGLVFLGKEAGGEAYRSGEIEILSTLLGQASFAFDNAYLYHQQKTRLKKLYRADRLATLGQLAAGAAHEIRNPLTSIRSTIQFIQKDLPDPDKRALVAEVIGEVDRINDIIEGLLSFSRPGKPRIEPVDLDGLLKQTLSLVATTAAKKNIDMTLEFDSQEKKMTADPSQLKQVFLNIVMNALQAMDSGGKLLITVYSRKIGGLFQQARDCFSIVFQDSGEGIPREHLEHVFDPFFTTKRDGTGLGLSISYGIIQQHQGDIEIESVSAAESPGDHGTRVTVTLPMA